MITFGGYDLERYATGPIRWHNIDTNSDSRKWEIHMNELSFDGKEDDDILRNEFKNRNILVDSGTSFVLMPKDDLYKLMDFLSRKYDITCQLTILAHCALASGEATTVDMFPDLRFVLDGFDYYMPRESYVSCYDSGQCMVKIMNNPYISFWLIGLNFFENYYAVFDQEDMRIGFAPSIHAVPRMREL